MVQGREDGTGWRGLCVSTAGMASTARHMFLDVASKHTQAHAGKPAGKRRTKGLRQPFVGQACVLAQ
eukprot:scaffold176480_cov20-Tisochrysis_lutea.AAC.1